NIAGQLREASLTLDSYKSSHLDTVKVGVFEGPPVALLAQAVTEAKLLDPKIRIVIHTDDSDSLAAKVKDERLDFAIGRTPNRRDPLLYTRLGLTKDEIRFVSRRTHPILKSRS